MDQKLAMLARVPLLAGLGQKDLVQVGMLCDEVDLASGHVLVREGDRGNEFYVLLNGSVEIARGGVALATLGPGDFLGEIALVDRGPRTATATATTAIRALVLGTREFHSLMDAHVSIRTCVLEALAQRVRRLEPNAT